MTRRDTPLGRKHGIYLAAAQLVLSGSSQGCCGALGNAEGDTHGDNGQDCIIDDVAGEFRDLFMPDGAGSFWWETGEIEPRVLALCFMAAMEENP